VATVKILQEKENIAAIINLNQLDKIVDMLSNVSRDDFDSDEDVVAFTLMESRAMLNKLIRQLVNKR